MKVLPLMAFLGCIAACERPAIVWRPQDTREERGPFPVGFVGSFGGQDATASQRVLEVLQRELDGATLRGRTVELHVLNDAGSETACAAAIQRFAREYQAPLVILASTASYSEPVVEPALIAIRPAEDVSAAVQRIKTALETAKHLTPKDVRAALVGSAP
jgi:hypothetical protein